MNSSCGIVIDFLAGLHSARYESRSSVLSARVTPSNTSRMAASSDPGSGSTAGITNPAAGSGLAVGGTAGAAVLVGSGDVVGGSAATVSEDSSLPPQAIATASSVAKQSVISESRRILGNLIVPTIFHLDAGCSRRAQQPDAIRCLHEVAALLEMVGFSNAGLAIKSGYVSVLNPAKCLPFGGLVADELAMKWKGVAAADVGWPMSLRAYYSN